MSWKVRREGKEKGRILRKISLKRNFEKLMDF